MRVGGGWCDGAKWKAPLLWASQHEGGGEVTGPASQRTSLQRAGWFVCQKLRGGKEGAHVAQMGDWPPRGSEKLPATGATFPALRDGLNMDGAEPGQAPGRSQKGPRRRGPWCSTRTGAQGNKRASLLRVCVHSCACACAPAYTHVCTHTPWLCPLRGM